MRNRGVMSKSRREFLTNSSLGLLSIAITSCDQEQQPAELPPGAPPAFATAPPVGPEVSPLTFAEAQKLVQVELNEEERDEEESHQHHGDSTHPTKSVTDFLPYIQWLPPSITRRQLVPTPYNSPQLGPSAITENQNWTLLNTPVLRPLRPAPPPLHTQTSSTWYSKICYQITR